MPSGKQILLETLRRYSQTKVNDGDLNEISDQLRAALLIHGSTADESWSKVEETAWLSEKEDGTVVRQGLGLEKKRVFLSDLFEAIVEDERMPDSVSRAFPELTPTEYSKATEIIWLLLSSLQYFDQLSSVENGGNLEEKEMERFIENYKVKLREYRKNPNRFLGKE